MNENVSPRPWGWNDDETIVDANGNDITLDESNAEYLLTAINEHDSLVAEVERLKQENEKLRLYEMSLQEGTVDLVVGGKPAAIFMGTLIGFFRQNKGDNYLTLTIQDKNNNKYGINIENCNGKLSVAEKLNNHQRENEQLREALKKCSPWNDTLDCPLCGGIDPKFGLGHKPDCEYVRLCGGYKDAQR